MQIREIMSSDPACVTPETSVEEAARLMKDKDVGLLPVIDTKNSNQLAGVVTDRDIAIRYVADGSRKKSVKDIMSSDIATCRHDSDVDTVMELMGREQVRRIPIVDERGTLVGVVAQADIVLHGTNDTAAQKTVEQISKPSEKHSQ